ncbi:MAG: GAF domain-containing sensor histidine kinase, partial [Longimicrobiales bacterium]
GFLGIGFAPRPDVGTPSRRFRHDDVDALAVFARHVAIAIDNARRYKGEQRRTERFELVARIAQTITADLRLRDVLQSAADAIHQLLGYSNVAIVLAETEEPGTPVFRAANTPEVSTDDAGAVAVAGDGMSTGAGAVPPALSGARSLALPIRLKDHVLGVLNIEDEDAFAPEDVAGLEIVADQLAVAIENARLYERGHRLAILEERQRLARELHDSVTQQVFGLTLVAQSLEPAWRRDPEEGARRAGRLLELSRTALAEMRGLLAELRPAESIEAEVEVIEPLAGIGRVRRDGLSQALRNYTTGPQFEELEVRVETRGYRRQAEALENALYWIAREALHNVVKHASARIVELRLASDNGVARLIVEDDGVGFDADAPLRPRPDGSGFGLASMRDRARALGGHLSIRSAPSSGTHVSVAVPLGDN